ncbi:conserved hypothetical protein [Ricinus communis]|uniref:Uncharacterized protein n=1 Tax=Ricinus communis TaxID=3988 RepID=B9SFB3_RICCO|nr:conserved hypothetical protein [Ricinus communis]
MASTSTKRDHEPDKENECESKKARTGDTADTDSPKLQLPKKRAVLNPADCN